MSPRLRTSVLPMFLIGLFPATGGAVSPQTWHTSGWMAGP